MESLIDLQCSSSTARSRVLAADLAAFVEENQIPQTGRLATRRALASTLPDRVTRDVRKLSPSGHAPEQRQRSLSGTSVGWCTASQPRLRLSPRYGTPAHAHWRRAEPGPGDVSFSDYRGSERYSARLDGKRPQTSLRTVLIRRLRAFVRPRRANQRERRAASVFDGMHRIRPPDTPSRRLAAPSR